MNDRAQKRSLPEDTETARTSSPEADSIRANQMYRKYRVGEKLGEGGMGVVYEAHDGVLDRLVAIKVISPKNDGRPAMHKAMNRESKVLAALHHENIVKFYDADITRSGQYFFVMELLEGVTLRAVSHVEGALDIRSALSIGLQIAKAISVAHQSNIVHRDLKPENVFVLPGGRVVVVDFGLAKRLADAGMVPSTDHTGDGMGTPHYMSPEQCLAKDVDKPTDIYSLALVVYELLAGKFIFARTTDDVPTAYEAKTQHLLATPTPLPTFLPSCPPSLWALLERMLAKEAADRPTAEQVIRALHAELTRAMEDRPVGGEARHLREPPASSDKAEAMELRRPVADLAAHAVGKFRSGEGLASLPHNPTQPAAFVKSAGRGFTMRMQVVPPAPPPGFDPQAAYQAAQAAEPPARPPLRATQPSATATGAPARELSDADRALGVTSSEWQPWQGSGKKKLGTEELDQQGLRAAARAALATRATDVALPRGATTATTADTPMAVESDPSPRTGRRWLSPALAPVVSFLLVFGTYFVGWLLGWLPPHRGTGEPSAAAVAGPTAVASTTTSATAVPDARAPQVPDAPVSASASAAEAAATAPRLPRAPAPAKKAFDVPPEFVQRPPPSKPQPAKESAKKAPAPIFDDQGKPTVTTPKRENFPKAIF